MLNAQRAALLAAFLFALPLMAPAHERDAGQADDRLVDKFARFAGSRSNAESLVNGLRNDQDVKLTSTTQGSAAFTPKTDKMGFGNVNIALTLAKATLAEHGISRPTPQQIEAALNGGTITDRSGKQVVLTGILTQRASGMGWGKIAHANGFKLGELMRHHGDFRHHRHHAEFKHREHHRAEFHNARFDRHDRPQRFERHQRPEKFERVERVERAERPERPERHRRG
ncbi:MAG: hypothetical protein ACJ8G4_21545 [Burkholderiales bacterium]